jgi:hypothetical protein
MEMEQEEKLEKREGVLALSGRVSLEKKAEEEGARHRR